MSRRVPVFNVGMCEEFDQAGICLYDIVRTSDGASIAMDIESLDQDELRRSVILVRNHGSSHTRHYVPGLGISLAQ